MDTKFHIDNELILMSPLLSSKWMLRQVGALAFNIGLINQEERVSVEFAASAAVFGGFTR